VKLNTDPRGAKIAYIPLSSGGEPQVDRAIVAHRHGPAEIELVPGMYFVEVESDDGRSHQVFRKVPSPNEFVVMLHRYRSWSRLQNGTFALPIVAIPEKNVRESMVLVNIDDASGDNESRKRATTSLFVDQDEVSVGDFETAMGFLPGYVKLLNLKSSQPIPLMYDDAVDYAEHVGSRLPTAKEWQAVQKGLPKRTQQSLAEWTMSLAERNFDTVDSSDEGHKEGQIVCGASNRVLKGEDNLSESDYSTRNLAVVSPAKFYPTIGLRCVRASTPLYFKDITLIDSVGSQRTPQLQSPN
jgi:hypothetical protein